MRGRLLYNWPAFETAAIQLRKQGFEVVSPTELDEDAGYVKVRRNKTGVVVHVELTPLFTLDAATSCDRKAIDGCDAVAVLPGWELSAGAQAETLYAMDRGMRVRSVAAWLDTESNEI
jgi:hypothetical protein